MKQTNWERFFLQNTLSNYLRMILRVVSGLVLFRLTYQNLSTEAFGFYALLWSFFGYTVLLDFGLGFTTQKAVAESMATRDITSLNRLVTTIFWTFSFMGCLLLVFFILIEPFFLDAIGVSLHNLPSFKLGYTFFFTAMALGFPLGIFPEMLRGLQRIDLANWLLIGGNVLNLILLPIALLNKWPFEIVVLISTATSIFPDLLALPLLYRKISGFSLHPRHFRWSSVQQVLSFSLVSYLITFTHLIASRTDQAVISLSLGVSLVALYQAGYKVSEMLNMFSLQIHDMLSPAAAELKTLQDKEGLKKLLLRSTHLTILISTPLYALAAAYLEPVIRILTSLKQIDSQTFWVGQLLLLAAYSSLVTNSCSKRIMMMCGLERKLLRLSLIDAGLNLTLSVILVLKLGVMGVALGTLIPTALIGWLAIVPLTARFIHMSSSRLLTAYIQPVFLPIGASLVTLAILLKGAPMASDAGLWECVWRGIVVLSVLALFSQSFFFSSRSIAKNL